MKVQQCNCIMCKEERGESFPTYQERLFNVNQDLKKLKTMLMAEEDKSARYKVENLEIIDELHETRAKLSFERDEYYRLSKKFGEAESAVSSTKPLMWILLILFLICLSAVIVATVRYDSVKEELRECQSDCQ